MNHETTYRILQALPEHITALADIERAAATLFPEEVLPNKLRNQTISIDTLVSARQRGLLQNLAHDYVQSCKLKSNAVWTLV